MGRAARAAQAKARNEDELIEEEKCLYPWLWATPYVVNLKRKQNETMQRLGFEWEHIGFVSDDLDGICESAERWQTGAGQIVREQQLMKGKCNV
ncbi:MAG: hypothetical protein WC373_05275 [Smithella sp.]|jgi:hypothetical protein